MKFALSFRCLYVLYQMVHLLFCTGIEHVCLTHALSLGHCMLLRTWYLWSYALSFRHFYVMQHMIFLLLCTEFWTLNDMEHFLHIFLLLCTEILNSVCTVYVLLQTTKRQTICDEFDSVYNSHCSTYWRTCSGDISSCHAKDI